MDGSRRRSAGQEYRYALAAGYLPTQSSSGHRGREVDGDFARGATIPNVIGSVRDSLAENSGRRGGICTRPTRQRLDRQWCEHTRPICHETLRHNCRICDSSLQFGPTLSRHNLQALRLRLTLPAFGRQGRHYDQETGVLSTQNWNGSRTGLGHGRDLEGERRTPTTGTLQVPQRTVGSRHCSLQTGKHSAEDVPRTGCKPPAALMIVVWDRKLNVQLKFRGSRPNRHPLRPPQK